MRTVVTTLTYICISIILMAYQNCGKALETNSEFSSSSLPTLSIDSIPKEATVVADPIGKIEINLSSPVEREDGSALNSAEISHYIIKYGLESGKYNSELVTATANPPFVLDSLLVESSYYVVLVTVDSEGRESGNSNEIIKVAN